jgi:hypothetical protein
MSNLAENINLNLPSAHAIGDTIVIPCTVKGVHFSESKVRYIVDIGGYLLNIDSADAFTPEGEQAQAKPTEVVQVVA